MKVVLFCGGLGTRLREHSDTIPKPLVPIGSRPIIWHLMRYYAHFGHTDFILCLGYRGDLIRRYFLDYDPYADRDFTLTPDGPEFCSGRSDIADWRITFVDTGLHANIADRLVAVREYLDGEQSFLANYSDQVCDLPLDQYLAASRERAAVASFLSVRPSSSYHAVKSDADGYVQEMEEIGRSDVWVNGGYFHFQSEIFDYIRDGEELVIEPFARLMEERKLWTLRYDGFWKSMDTFKDKIAFDRMHGRRDRPWRIWTDSQ